MRGSAIVFATELTGVSAFAERVGADGGATVVAAGGCAGGAEAQAATNKSDRATAVRFIVRHPCKKRDSGSDPEDITCSPRYTFQHETETENDPHHQASYERASQSDARRGES